MTTLGNVIRSAMWDEMTASPRSMLWGEAITSRGGASKLTYGFEEEFGSHRVLETPISENALIGGAFGAALAGMRVICEVYSADFLFCGGSEVFNDMAKWRYEHQYEAPINLVLRMPTGSGGSSGGPEHCQAMEGYLHHCPGLRVVVPNDAQSAYESIRHGLNTGDPVIVLEHRSLYNEPVDDYSWSPDAPPSPARVVRAGSDVTLVAWGRMTVEALAAANDLGEQGVSAEVINVTSIKPFPFEVVGSSAGKTGAVLVIEEGPMTGSVASEVLWSLVESSPDLAATSRRLTMPDVSFPYPSQLERDVIPTREEVVRRALEITSRRQGEST